MINLIRAELFKLKRNHTFWILMGVVPVIYAIYMGGDFWRINDMGIYNLELEEYINMSTMGLMKQSLGFNLIISTLAAFFINADYTTGIIKNEVLSGNKRSHIYMAKLIIFSLASVTNAVILPVITIVLGTFILGHKEIYTSETIIYWMRAFGLYTFIIISYSSIITLIATLTKESGKTIIITVVMSIVLSVIEILLVPELEIVKMIYENSIFYQAYQAFNPIITSNEIGKNIFISLVTFMMATYLGSMIFRKEEIK